MAEEIELKLLASAAFDEDALVQRLEALGEMGPPQRFDQRDTYLDTESGDLRRAGLSARVRAKTDFLSVGVKAVPIDSGLVMRRLELFSDVHTDAEVVPALERLLKSELGMALRGAAKPCLHVATDRTVRIWRSDSAQVEICVDRVRVLDADEKEVGTFSEVEAELASGDPDVLESIASVLQGPTLSPSGQAKYPRARELAGLPPYAYGAPAPAFDGTTSVDEVARSVCRQQLATMRSYELGTRIGIDTEHLHKMRVASRRLRTALRVFEGSFPEAERTELGRDLKWIGRRLGAVRDLDVHTLSVPRWRSELGAKPDAGWNALRQRLAERRGAAQSRVLKALDGPRWPLLCERAEALFAHGDGTGASVADAAPALLATPVEAFGAGVQRFRETHDLEDAHQLRILGKRVRYTAGFLRPLLSESGRESLKRLSDFQDTLGALQDAVAAADFADAEAKPNWSSSVALAFVLGKLSGAAQTLTAQARANVDAALELLDPRTLSDLLST